MTRALALAITMAVTRSELPAQDGAARAPRSIAAPPPLRDGRHDFDFLHGSWRIHNRRLRHPLTGSSEWYEFEGRSVERPLWDGQANLEEYDATLPNGTPLRGLALRLYEPKTRRWTIHWSNSASGTLDAPMTGAFRDGVGEFLSHEEFEGRMILVRFHWSSPGPDRARWEQAFSADGGRSWETNWIMEFRRAPEHSCCAVLELRQYELHSGQRETLIDLFERELMEPQEALGMTLIGPFRDLDRPNVFTWLRGFPDMPSRAASLGAFYGGAVWARHRDAANATMVNSDNVRLLHPAAGTTGFALGEREPSGQTSGASRPGIIVATIYTLAPNGASDFAALFSRTAAPVLSATGAAPIAMFETEASPNNFPRLPVREGERCFVWFALFADSAAYDRHLNALASNARWDREVLPVIQSRFAGPPEILRLSPTARSRVPQ
jgi:hypothetical protein